MLTAAGEGEFDQLEVMGFGDFNHDGIQDMLVWTSNSGGERWSSTMQLS